MDTTLFRNVVPFVAVAEARSFRGAAAALGVSPAAVSKAVQALEGDLGAALFVRGPRAVTLTREGELFFAQCRQAVAALQGARQAVTAARKAPEGELVISAPFVVASLLARALALLRVRCPRLCCRVRVNDRLSRLSEDEVDVAVRVGPLTDSSLVARRLRGTRLVTVASPAYLARKGAPQRVDDLDAHDCLVWLAPTGKARAWLFHDGPREVASAALIDHAPTLLDGALAGLGLAQVFDFMADAPVREGRLVRVLDEATAEGPDVWAVCVPGRRADARTRAAFEAFADTFPSSG